VHVAGKKPKEKPMSVTAARPAEVVDAPAKRGSKKLLMFVVLVLLALVAAGGAAVVIAKKHAAAAAEAEAGDEPAGHGPAAAHDWRKAPPAFLPMDVFVVNLADRDTERFAQIGVTLELDDAKSAEDIKAYMPAIRNAILMVLAHKTSQQLLDRAGKEKLAREILHESMRPLGIEFTDPAPAKAGADEDTPSPAVSAPEGSPVRRVHFSSFIIQ